MEILTTFRHEFKYTINYSEVIKIKSKLQKIMDIDRDINGYIVRSLYFDSPDDIDLNEKLIGTMTRKKIRLRIYEPNADFVKLEIKNKFDIHQLKESIVIDRKTAEEIIDGNYEVLLKYNNEIATKIYTIMRKNGYIPKVIIEYDRVAFKTKTTTRITMDLNIRKSDKVKEFFNEKIDYLRLYNANQGVLEVKFDKFLEPYIGKVLSNFTSQHEAVSKYLMARY